MLVPSFQHTETNARLQEKKAEICKVVSKSCKYYPFYFNDYLTFFCEVINSIFFVSPDNKKYTEITESAYNTMIQELEDKYDITETVDLDDTQAFQFNKL